MFMKDIIIRESPLAKKTVSKSRRSATKMVVLLLLFVSILAAHYRLCYGIKIDKEKSLYKRKYNIIKSIRFAPLREMAVVLHPI